MGGEGVLTFLVLCLSHPSLNIGQILSLKFQTLFLIFYIFITPFYVCSVFFFSGADIVTWLMRNLSIDDAGKSGRGDESGI